MLLERQDALAVLPPPVVLAKERLDPASSVVAARRVAKERIESDGGVFRPVVLLRSAFTPLAVPSARGVLKERIDSVGSVQVARRCQ